MTFMDITIVPVPTENKSAYLEFSRRVAAIYQEHGALRVIDCWQAEDASSEADFHAEAAMAAYPAGTLPSFRKLARVADGQTVVVSLTEWPSREARDLGVRGVLADPRIADTIEEEPVFDGSRLIAGGFTVEMDFP
jgi:uncharacterized protein YbaA (DUF1428 family)